MQLPVSVLPARYRRRRRCCGCCRWLSSLMQFSFPSHDIVACGQLARRRRIVCRVVSEGLTKLSLLASFTVLRACITIRDAQVPIRSNVNRISNRYDFLRKPYGIWVSVVPKMPEVRNPPPQMAQLERTVLYLLRI